MDGLNCSRDRVSEILVRLIRREADFVFRAHSGHTFSLYAEDSAAEMVRTMVPTASLFRHEDGTNSVWIMFHVFK
jgi:hypothetical protein